MDQKERNKNKDKLFFIIIIAFAWFSVSSSMKEEGELLFFLFL